MNRLKPTQVGKVVEVQGAVVSNESCDFNGGAMYAKPEAWGAAKKQTKMANELLFSLLGQIQTHLDLNGWNENLRDKVWVSRGMLDG